MMDPSSCSLPDNTVYTGYLAANPLIQNFPSLPTIQKGNTQNS